MAGKRAEISSPGKLILAGEHVVLYGYKALAFPIDRYTDVKIQDSNKKDEINIQLKNFNSTLNLSYEKLFGGINFGKNHEIILKTLKVFFSSFSEGIFKSINILVNSKIPIGGFGSSTAVSAATFKALMEIFGIKIENKDLINYIIDVESSNGVRVSGLDQTVIVEDRPIIFTRHAQSTSYKNLYAKNKYIRECIVINTGEPNEITSQVVAHVRSLYSSNKKKTEEIFNTIGSYCSKLEALVQETSSIEILEIINLIGQELIKLEIVTPYCQSIMKDLKALGASAKISGAGALSGKGSGALICFSNNQRDVIKYLDAKGLNYFQTKLF